MRGVVVFSLLVLLLVLFMTPPVSALGIAQEYLENSTLRLIKGGTYYFDLVMQNPSDEPISVTLNLTSEKNVAEIVDHNETYILPPKSFKNNIQVKVVAPKKSFVGDSFKVRYSMMPFQEQEGGQLGMVMKISQSFDVLIVNEDGVGINTMIKIRNFFRHTWSILISKTSKIILGILALLGIVAIFARKSLLTTKNIIGLKLVVVRKENDDSDKVLKDATKKLSKAKTDLEPEKKKVAAKKKSIQKKPKLVVKSIKPKFKPKSKEKIIEKTKEVKIEEKIKVKLKETKPVSTKKKTSSRKKSKIDLSKEVSSSDEYFHFNNGTSLKSVMDLYHYLPVMPDSSFYYHVSKDKNDFANWIEGVLNFKILAAKLRKCKNKASFRKVIQDEIEK